MSEAVLVVVLFVVLPWFGYWLGVRDERRRVGGEDQ